MHRAAAKGEIHHPPPPLEMGRDAPGWERAPFNPVTQRRDSPFLLLRIAFVYVCPQIPSQPLQTSGGEQFKEEGEAKAPQAPASTGSLPPTATKTRPNTRFSRLILRNTSMNMQGRLSVGVFLVKYTEKIKETPKCGPMSMGTSAACVGEVAPRDRNIR